MFRTDVDNTSDLRERITAGANNLRLQDERERPTFVVVRQKLDKICPSVYMLVDKILSSFNIRYVGTNNWKRS